MNSEPVHVIAPPPLVYLPFLVAGILAHFLWQPLRFFPETWIGHAAGWPLVVLGLLIEVWSFRAFSQSGEDVRIWKPTEGLVSGGPYRFSRNPIYVGMTLIYIGVALAFNTFWPLILLPVALALIHYGVIKREEEYLARLFGDEYRQYQGKVRRWL